MLARTLLPAAVGLGLAVAAAPADAAPRRKPKPITKKYTVTAPVPLPYPSTGNPCSAGTQGVSEHREPFAAPAAGRLTVVVTEFTGDWDVALFDTTRQVAVGRGVDTPSLQTGTERETLAYPIRGKGQYYIDVCNFLGGHSAKVAYTFVYA